MASSAMGAAKASAASQSWRKEKAAKLNILNVVLVVFVGDCDGVDGWRRKRGEGKKSCSLFVAREDETSLRHEQGHMMLTLTSLTTTA